MAGASRKKGGEAVIEQLPMTFADEDLQALRQAFMTLEHPSLAARISNVVGTPIEIALHLLPKQWYRQIHEAAEKAVAKALDTAISTLRRDHEASARESYYQALAAGAGGVGGFFGLPGILLELPVTTTLMLRGIAEIARDENEDLDSLETRMACVQVFALGGRSEIDDAAETGYYGVRFALSGYMTSATHSIARHGFSAETAPVVLRLANAIAHRFGIVISQRAALQIMPVIGALGGASVNAIFMQHFQSMARAHFTVRRLEKKYEPEFFCLDGKTAILQLLHCTSGSKSKETLSKDI